MGIIVGMCYAIHTVYPYYGNVSLRSLLWEVMGIEWECVVQYNSVVYAYYENMLLRSLFWEVMGIRVWEYVCFALLNPGQSICAPLLKY